MIIFIILLLAAQIQTAPSQSQSQSLTRSFDELYEDAENLYADNQLEKALQLYKELIKKYPQNEAIEQVRLRLAQCYYKLGEDLSAIQIYQDMIATDPNNVYASQAVSQIGNLFSQRYQFNEAIMTLLRVYDQYPKSKAAEMAGYLIGGYFYFQRMPAKAVEHYKRFLKDYPDSVFRGTAINQLINIYINDGMLEEAENMLNELKERIDNIELMQQLASIYQKKGEYDEAIKLYESVLNINPNNSYLREKLGEIYAQKGDKNRALIEWSKLVASNTDDYSRHQQLGYIYKSHGFYEEAEKAYKNALSLQPKTPYLYTQLADIYKIQNRLEDAADCYLNALVASGISYGNREDILTEMFELVGNSDLAKLKDVSISKARQMFEKEPNVDVALTLSEIELFAGKFNEALNHFETLSKIYPDQGALLIKYAQRLQRDGELKAAEAFFEKAINLFPSSFQSLSAKLELAEVKRSLNQPQEAALILREMLQNALTDQSPLKLEVYALLGEIQLYDLKDPKSALLSFRTLQALSPQIVQRYNLRVRILECRILIEENPDIEKGILEVADGIDQEALEALKLLGDFYFFNDKIKEATSQYQKAAELLNSTLWGNDAIYKLSLIKQNSDYAGVPLKLYAKAWRLEKIGSVNEALKAYDDIITTFPKSGIKDDVIIKIGTILIEQKRYAEAISICQDLAAANGLLAPEAQAKVADSYRMMGQSAQAIKEYSALIERYPDSVLAIYARGEIDKLK